jgi:ribosome-binding factor A
MAREFKRTDRVGDYLLRELAILIQRDLRDPRLGMVSLTAVEVSRDISHARVYFTLLGSNTVEEAKPTTDVLNKAAGFLRTALAKEASMRSVPRLRFVFDSSVGRGRDLEALITRATDADARLHLDADNDASSSPAQEPVQSSRMSSSPSVPGGQDSGAN